MITQDGVYGELVCIDRGMPMILRQYHGNV